MLTNITIDRPLAILDLETTGTDPQNDRVVEISILKLPPDERQDEITIRLNPGLPIPAEATAIRGIRDGDVIAEPRFEDRADGLLHFLDACDFCGFNIRRFDLRFLCAEFSRVGRTFPIEGRVIIDVMEISAAFTTPRIRPLPTLWQRPMCLTQWLAGTVICPAP